MGLHGDLTTWPLRDLLEWLWERKASGTLTLTRAMSVRRFHLRNGRVSLSSSSDRQISLGRQLVERGLVAPDALEETLAARGSVGPRLGKTLLKAGLVSQAALVEILAENVQRLFDDALFWQDGAFSFDDGARPVRRAAVAMAVSLEHILDCADPRPLPDADANELLVGDGDVIEEAPAEADPNDSAEAAAPPATASDTAEATASEAPEAAASDSREPPPA